MSPECPPPLQPGPEAWFLTQSRLQSFSALSLAVSPSLAQAYQGLGVLSHPTWEVEQDGFEPSLGPASPLQVGVTMSLQMSSPSTTFFIVLGEAWSTFPPRFLAMLLSKALRSLCFQTIYYKPRSLPERWEGRRSAVLRLEEALELTQEFLASWFFCPQRHLLSHFSDWPACKLSPNPSQGK